VSEEYIVEFLRVGDSIKVSAIDPKTGTEASIVAPAKGVTQKQMQDTAVKKLQYVLNKSKVNNS
jgi:hypothetical protein